MATLPASYTSDRKHAISPSDQFRLESRTFIVIFFLVLCSVQLISQPLGSWYRVPAPGDVQSVFVTSDSTLFACTNTGLYKEDLHTGDWNFYSSADGFIGNDIYNCAQDGSGNLYFASSPLAELKNNSFISFPLDSIPEAADVVVDKTGSLWCAAWNGVYRHGPTGWTYFTDGIGEGNHLALALDSVGNVWCGGGDDDISYYDSLGWHLEQFFDGGIRGDVTALTASKDGSVWVGTSQCYLGRRQNGVWSLARSDLFPWYVTGIAVNNDTVWVSARSLFRGIGSSWTQLHTSDGLADDIPIIQHSIVGELFGSGTSEAVFLFFSITLGRSKNYKVICRTFMRQASLQVQADLSAWELRQAG